MLRTRRHWIEALACALVAPAGVVTATTPSTPRLQCECSVAESGRAGAPVVLHFTLVNRGRQTVQVLEWGTPFEGWLAPFVDLLRDGTALQYAGASVKRGDPGREEYLTLAPGARRKVGVDLAEAFDLRRAGSYLLRPRITLHDVYFGVAVENRTRAQHHPYDLNCRELRFTLAG
ncbi:MAG: hypothetical protein ABIO45_10620 [Burkholderiaceae bacterium]